MPAQVIKIMNTETQTATIALHTVGIVVDDLKASLAFYRLVGLPIADGQDEEFHVEYTAPNGYAIGFIPKQTMLYTNPAWTAPTGDNRISLQFNCQTVDEVNAAYARLIAAGHRSFRAPWDADWGQRFAQVLDPDGNNIGLFAEL